MTIGEAWRITNRELWTERAVCRDRDPDVFFPPPRSRGLEAKAVRQRCRNARKLVTKGVTK